MHSYRLLSKSNQAQAYTISVSSSFSFCYVLDDFTDLFIHIPYSLFIMQQQPPHLGATSQQPPPASSKPQQPAKLGATTQPPPQPGTTPRQPLVSDESALASKLKYEVRDEATERDRLQGMVFNPLM